MFDINNLIQSAAELEVIDGGAWVGDLDDAPGVELKVRGLKSVEARKAMEACLAGFRAKNKGKPITEQQYAEAMRTTLADAVLLDWRGLSADGKALKFDAALARAWLTTRQGEKGFQPLVMAAAQRLDDQSAEFAKAVTKN